MDGGLIRRGRTIRPLLLAAISSSIAGVGCVRSRSRALMSSASAAAGAAATQLDSPALRSLRFDNAALRKLRVSPEFHGPPRQISGAHFVRALPTPLDSPRLVAKSRDALSLVGLGALSDEELARVLSGNELLPGSEPACHCYCGHQFGAFAGQLGDGAAMYLGEVMSEHGRWELQLKGAGLTPFSRAADGRKVLRSSIREFLASEAMAALGVPTTRAAACVTSSSTVPRDVLYNGNAREEQCAVVSRVSRTFLRFGSFEICRPRDAQTGRAGPSAGAADARALVSELIDFVCELDGEQGGDLARAGASGSTERARALLECTAGRTAALLARWQAVGFTHGVLNTDNMAVLGETIDYGPFGFMGHFCKDYTPNSSDNGHRYSYEAQPRAAEWNVAKFAETLRLARVIDAADADMVAQGFWPAYERELLHAFRAKLALTSRGADDADRALLDQLLHALDESGADMCAAFLALGALPRAVHAASSADVELGGVLGRLEQASTSLRAAAKLARPAMPPAALRQIIALSTTDPARLAMFGIDDEVVRAAKQQLAKLDAIAALGSDVQKRARDRDAWEAWLRAYAARLHTEADGDTADGASLAEREARMAASNPAFVLREHLLQAAIARAECGDFAHVRQLLDRAQTPFLPGPIDEAGWSALVAELPTEDALDIVLS